MPRKGKEEKDFNDASCKEPKVKKSKIESSETRKRITRRSSLPKKKDKKVKVTNSPDIQTTSNDDVNQIQDNDEINNSSDIQSTSNDGVNQIQDNDKINNSSDIQSTSNSGVNQTQDYNDINNSSVSVHKKKMTNTEIYPCYIRVGDDENDFMELPSENDGTILLSTIQAQYPNVTGLKYKSESGGWRGIRLSENILDPPPGGWGDVDYYVTHPKHDAVKRKLEQSPKKSKVVKTSSEDEMLQDLIVLGLTYSATEDELKNYFEQFGELSMHEIKRDPKTQKSKGFGFIRYKDVDAAKQALKLEHLVAGRRCEVRLPKRRDEKPMKLFIGRLKEGTTSDDLREHFSQYGDLKDVYVPKDFRGFGFVTFDSQEVAQEVMNTTHIIEGSCVNVTYAEPKGKNDAPPPQQVLPQGELGYSAQKNNFNYWSRT